MQQMTENCNVSLCMFVQWHSPRHCQLMSCLPGENPVIWGENGCTSPFKLRFEIFSRPELTDQQRTTLLKIVAREPLSKKYFERSYRHPTPRTVFHRFLHTTQSTKKPSMWSSYHTVCIRNDYLLYLKYEMNGYF